MYLAFHSFVAHEEEFLTTLLPGSVKLLIVSFFSNLMSVGKIISLFKNIMM